MPLSDLGELGIGDPSTFGYGVWRYNSPEQRVSQWNSPNTGDIVLLANGRDGFQFGSPYRGQHGSLTYADSRVPVAFGFPGASADSTEDTLLAPIRQFLMRFGEEAIPGLLLQKKVVQEMLEADALRAFFGVSKSP